MNRRFTSNGHIFIEILEQEESCFEYVDVIFNIIKEKFDIVKTLGIEVLDAYLITFDYDGHGICINYHDMVGIEIGTKDPESNKAAEEIASYVIEKLTELREDLELLNKYRDKARTLFYDDRIFVCIKFMNHKYKLSSSKCVKLIFNIIKEKFDVVERERGKPKRKSSIKFGYGKCEASVEDDGLLGPMISSENPESNEAVEKIADYVADRIEELKQHPELLDKYKEKLRLT